MTSREHLVTSRTNSGLRADGMPAQRSKPGADPDLFRMKETAAPGFERCAG